MADSLGDRQKGYESVAKGKLVPGVPVVVRVDGRAFHTLTRGCDKPFDHNLIDSMVLAAKYTAESMQGFKVAYIQSDEATFVLTDTDTVETQAWFGNNRDKIISISAATMTNAFNWAYDKTDTYTPDRMAVFDSRAFNVPRADVENNLLWRAKDWNRNSLQMFCRAHFSHNELHGKGRQAMHNMLHERGLNWTTDTIAQERNGTFLVNLPEEGIVERHDILPTYESIRQICEHF